MLQWTGLRPSAEHHDVGQKRWWLGTQPESLEIAAHTGIGLMVPLSKISNPEVRGLADEAVRFLETHSWCGRVRSGELAFAVAGVVGVFKIAFEPARSDVDSVLWIITGDLPPAYLVTDDAPDWQSALAAYIDEMRTWVAAVRNGSPTADVIPVSVAPTVEHAQILESRLDFLQREFVAVSADSIEGDV